MSFDMLVGNAEREDMDPRTSISYVTKTVIFLIHNIS